MYFKFGISGRKGKKHNVLISRSTMKSYFEREFFTEGLARKHAGCLRELIFHLY